MQLNNKETGETIKITKINTCSNIVFYIKKDVSNDIDKGISYNYKFRNYIISDDFEINTTIINNCYTKMQDENFPLFTTENNEQNWIVEDRPIRMIMPKEWIVDDVLSKPEYSDLATIVNRVRTESINSDTPFVFTGKSFIISYFNEVSSSDATIVNKYIYNETNNPTGKIIIETKNV